MAPKPILYKVNMSGPTQAQMIEALSMFSNPREINLSLDLISEATSSLIMVVNY